MRFLNNLASAERGPRQRRERVNFKMTSRKRSQDLVCSVNDGVDL